MADITLIAGRAGSGKSRLLRQRVAALCAAGGSALLLVPEQFTFEAERELAAAMQGGLLEASVASFTSLARRVLRETGERRVFLSRQGRRMIIRKAAEEEAKHLGAFAAVYARAGFTEECDAFFTQCKRFNIPPEALSAAAAQLEADTPFAAKLQDLSLLYARTEEYLAARSMDEADSFAALCERLPRSSVAGKAVFIDGFDLISEQLYDVIGALMDTASSLTVGLRCDLSPDCRDSAVFAAENRVLRRIRDIAGEKGKSVEILRLPNERLLKNEEEKSADPALRHLEHEAFAYPYSIYEGEGTALSLFAGTSRTAEAEAVADAILAAAKAGMRYRDMAVIATELDAYMNPVGRALRARGIPFFTDAKHPLAGYAAARLVTAALRACSRAYRAADVLALAKTGLAGVGQDGVEQLENYVLRFGVRGNGFAAPFTRGDAPAEAELARAALLEPLAALRTALAAAGTAAGKTEALYDYLCALDVRGQLVAQAERLRAEGQLELMEENAQVYNMLMEVLSQLHAILGDAPISTARYAAVLEEGLSAYEVGVIPTTADQVLFGSLGRTRARSVEALFVLGAVEGSFPTYVRDESMIDDAEIATLTALGLPELPTSRARTDKELADVYGAIAKPSRRLYLSYPMGIGAEAAVPCTLIDRIRTIFPDVRERTDLAPGEPASPETAFGRLVAGLRAGVDAGGMEEDMAALYASFAHAPDYAARLENAEHALYHRSSPEPFGRALSSALYGERLRGSATRLETFNTCPFKHFARYGLKLEPRREYRERRVDEGHFCHEALAAFTEAIIRDARPLASLDEAAIDALLDEVLPPIIAAHNNGILLDTARMRALCARLVRRVKLTAHALVAQLAAGSFRPEGCEVEFGAGKPYPPIELTLADGRRFLLSGKIDRLDSFSDKEGMRYVRIIDYKTGNTKFSYNELYHGLHLQLPLYIAAACAADDAARAAQPAGFYYLPVKEPTLNEKTIKEKDAAQIQASPEALRKALQKQLRLNGITLSEESLIDGTGEDVLTANVGGKLARDKFQTVTRYALKKAADTAEAMLEGHAETAPYRKSQSETACGLCDYASLCRFEAGLAGCTYRSIGKMDANKFFEEVQQHGMDD